MHSPSYRLLFAGGMALWLFALGSFIACTFIVVRHALKNGTGWRGQVLGYALSDQFDSPRRRLILAGLFGGMIATVVLGLVGAIAIGR